MQRTPLHADHLALGARMAPFGGWEMPIQYEGILAEHHRTRTAASVFDTCHMGEFRFEGPTAEADLTRLLTMDVAGLRAGRCRYGYLLNESGGVLDDLTCYRAGPDAFMVVVNAGTRDADRNWIRARLSAGTVFSDDSDALGKLDVQGPAARGVTESALGTPVPKLPFFGFADLETRHGPVRVSRTGYTGEFGYELYLAADAVANVWRELVEAGAGPAGLGARDTLRLEMGYPLYGQDLGPDRNPVAAARGMFLRPDADFVGGATVETARTRGVDRYLAGLRLTGRRAARPGDEVKADGAVVGEVTSGSFAPSLGVAVALAYVDDAFTRPGQRLAAGARKPGLDAEVVDLPFYREGTARRKDR